MINVNFAQIAEQKPVDDGIYPVIVRGFERTPKTDDECMQLIRDGKYPYMKVRFEISDGPDAGKAVFANMTLNPEPSKNGNAKNFMLCNFLKVLDLLPEDFFERDPEDRVIQFDPNDVLNRELQIQVTKEMGKDAEGNETEMRNNVKKFFPLD
jgi:hypothetical protein